jgi:hypothetical protein
MYRVKDKMTFQSLFGRPEKGICTVLNVGTMLWKHAGRGY